MKHKGEIYRLKDGKSHLCLSENEDMLVFAQVYYTDRSNVIVEINLDNLTLVYKSELKEMEYLEKLSNKIMEIKFTTAQS